TSRLGCLRSGGLRSTGPAQLAGATSRFGAGRAQLTGQRTTVPDPQDRLLASLVCSADDAIFGQSLDGTITSWNAGAQRLYGYAPDECIGTSAVRFIPPDRPNDSSDLLARIARDETVRQYETVHYSRDARRVRVVLTISPVRDESGGVTGAVTVARGAG